MSLTGPNSQVTESHNGPFSSRDNKDQKEHNLDTQFDQENLRTANLGKAGP
jgi:hypothetical protein